MELLLELIYNGFLFAMLGLWVMGMVKVRRPGGFARWLRSHKRFSVALVWGVFIVFASCYVAFFSTLNQDHDIPEAVNGAVNGLDQGLNPYVDPVVPRFDTTDDLGHTLGMGTYNYLPFDLMVYAGMHGMLSFAGFPAWFVVSNLFFSLLAFYLFKDLVRVKALYYIPLAGTVILFYSFDNCSLTVLLMVLSLYSLRILKGRNSEMMSIGLMGLAVLTKVYAVLPFIVLVLWLLQRRYQEHGFRGALRVLTASGGIAGLGVLLLLPFGVGNVLDSAVFFHLSAATRDGTSSGGTVLAELAMNNAYYAYIAIGAVIAAILASIRLRDLNDRVVLVSIVFLLVVVKSSLSLVTIPGLFLSIRYCELARAASAVKAARPTRTPHAERLSTGSQPEDAG